MKAGTIILLTLLAGGALLLARKKVQAQPGGITVIPGAVIPTPTFNFNSGVPVSVNPNNQTTEEVNQQYTAHLITEVGANNINWGSGGANWGQFGTQWGNTPLF